MESTFALEYLKKSSFVGLNGNVFETLCLRIYSLDSFKFDMNLYPKLRWESFSSRLMYFRISDCAIWNNNKIWISVLSLNRRQYLLRLWKKSCFISVSHTESVILMDIFSFQRKLETGKLFLGQTKQLQFRNWFVSHVIFICWKSHINFYFIFLFLWFQCPQPLTKQKASGC